MKSSSVLKLLLGLACSSFAADYFCYVPGAGGLGDYLKTQVVKELNESGIPFVAFPVSSKGDVKARAHELIKYFEELNSKDHWARCHLMAFSMGGLVIRYATAHLTFKDSDGNDVPLSTRVITESSVSSPHYGTPLAGFLKQNYPGLKPGLEDLTQEALKIYNDPNSEDYSPVLEGIPFFSYRTFVENKDVISGVLGRIGFQFITHFQNTMGLDPRNDGIVPTESMGFGLVLGDIERPHDMMSFDDGQHPNAIDFLTHHWNWLQSNVAN
jgi:hypothetical protein